MLSFSSRQKYYLYTQPTDMRKQFDGLSGLVRQHFKQEVMSGDVFIFINRQRNRIKLLMWDVTGYALYYKRLESGTFELPGVAAGENSVELGWPDLVFMLEGIELRSIKRRKRYRQRA
jgi:transposase